MGHMSSGIWFNGAPGIADNNTRASNPACKTTMFVVEPNKVYRMRVISGTTLSYASFAIAGHMLEVVEAEGFYTTPVKLDKIPLHSGQRYSILLRTTNTARLDFRMHTHTMNKDGTTSLHGMTLLRYSAPAKPDRIGSNDRYSPSQMPYSDSRLTALGEVPLSGSRLPFDVDWPMDWRTTNLGERAASSLFTPLVPNPAPPPVRRLYYRVTHEEREPEETPRWFVNNVTIKHPAVNLIAEAYKNTTHAHDETNYRLEHLDGNQVVEVVIQNTVDMVGVCDNHPWHLHGHSFWDMGSGPGKFSLEETQAYSPSPNPKRHLYICPQPPSIRPQPPRRLRVACCPVPHRQPWALDLPLPYPPASGLRHGCLLCRRP
ncbi:hypothetical protein DSO57_1031973 [Entomophthora muscae]|uniref:Uncharacterized protein n=1 Tax=Entomophthora muscae TaxID=34485 RepID=A0ACC2TCI5_9FUNG|nr:hypothetical protein DSO57_1031973 [Entomophthora muscae]